MKKLALAAAFMLLGIPTLSFSEKSPAQTPTVTPAPVQQIYLYSEPMTDSEMKKAEQKLEMYRQYVRDKEDPRRTTQLI
jgi:hypothetical protein